MNKLLVCILVLKFTVVLGQTPAETYLFAEDLYRKIEQDSVAWKYQTGASEFAFTGRYRDVLKTREHDETRTPKSSPEDSLYFINCQKLDAKTYITERAKTTRIVIINEAHHMAKHRTFTRSLLQGLYDNGYRYLGLEALFDPAINKRKFAVIESGYYTREPEFGNLVAEALNMGFTVFGYEASNLKNGKEREIEQAENILKFMERNREGKVLIHCGYAHAYENDAVPVWGKAMAGRLKELLNEDPLTINQTMFLERADAANSHLFMRLNSSGKPIVLVDSSQQVFNGFGTPKQTDVVLIHPLSSYINNRPAWMKEGKEAYVIPLTKADEGKPALIFAYRNNEYDSMGIPADLLEVEGTGEAQPQVLYLKKGRYEIVVKDRAYRVIKRYKIHIK